MSPKSVGHHYRVINHAEAFQTLGFHVLTISSETVASFISSFSDLKLIIVFRPSFNDCFRVIRSWADSHSIPLFSDFDDLIFDPTILDSGQWSFYDSLPSAEQSVWRQRVYSHYEALIRSDGAFVSTNVLVDSVRSLNKPCWLWQNGFGTRSWNCFQKARLSRLLTLPKNCNRNLTIGYASGTPTHAADFEIVSISLGSLLRKYSELRLCLIGWLDPSSYPALQGLEERIECRSLVTYDQLPFEYARLDINLAPLQEGSLFCRSKSALKFFEAAAVGVPTVASPTPPFKALMRNRWNGCLASSIRDWESEIGWLMESRSRRFRVSLAASCTIRKFCTPNAQRRDLKCILRQLSFL